MRRKIILIFNTALILATLLSVLPDKTSGSEYDCNNVVIVLDASGSMKNKMRGTSMKKMDAAKVAIQEVLKQVPVDTHIGLLVFSSSNLNEDWVYPLGPRDDAKLSKAISLPQAGGRTPLGAYIKKGVDRLLAERARQHGYGSYRLLIVTDGEAQDRDLVDRYVPEVVGRGITIDVVGVDMKTTHTLATMVHSYRRADDPASLKKAVAEVFAEVADTGSDIAGEDAFSQLAAIPDETAAAMLSALSISGNDPIGGKAGPGSPSKKTTFRKQSGKSKGIGTIVLLFFIMLIAVIIIWKVIAKR